MKLRFVFAFLLFALLLMLLAPGPALAQETATLAPDDDIGSIIDELDDAREEGSILLELYRETTSTYQRLILVLVALVIGVLAFAAVVDRERFNKFREETRQPGPLNLGLQGMAWLASQSPWEADDVAVALILDRLGHTDLAEQLRGRTRRKLEAPPSAAYTMPGAGGRSKTE
ncbi:MAG: hypothetical protein OHK0046_46160 [Anaerolineae bacterium]